MQASGGRSPALTGGTVEIKKSDLSAASRVLVAYELQPATFIALVALLALLAPSP